MSDHTQGSLFSRCGAEPQANTVAGFQGGGRFRYWLISDDRLRWGRRLGGRW